MATTRKQDLQHMAATLKSWAGQIADLRAKARSAGTERQLVIGRELTALRQQQRAYAAQLADTRGDQRGRVPGHATRRGADRRRIPQALPADGEPIPMLSTGAFRDRDRAQPECCCPEKDTGP